MGASVQRQTHSESSLPVAGNGRLKTSKTNVDAHKKQNVVPKRHIDKVLSCSCGYPSSMTDALKKRIQVLEVENHRLMTNQGQLVAETNRRVETHINEVRALKEELGKLQASNKELRDLCCFLDEDRQKTRRLSREWQKFGRYTCEIMKQEVKGYQAKLRELESRQHLLISENDELKRLCLYLDEQRQTILLTKTSRTDHLNNSEQNLLTKNVSSSIGCDSSGCGSSTGSQRGSEDEDDSRCEHEKTVTRYDDKQEKTLRMITEQLQSSLTLERCSSGTEKTCSNHGGSNEDQLLEYIQSLETRIRQLELSTQYKTEAQWPSDTRMNTEGRGTEGRFDSCGYLIVQSPEVSATFCESKQGVDFKGGLLPNSKEEILDSTTSTMTSSGTTYCSSYSDASGETSVFVTGEEFDTGVGQLEVRMLDPIDEETEDLCNKQDDLAHREIKNISVEDSPKNLEAQMPPTIAPVSASVSRLSSCCSDLSLDGASSHTTQTVDSHSSVARDSLVEAVKVLRVHEMAASKNMHGLTAQETALVQRMCQIAWDSLDRQPQPLENDCTVKSLKTQMTAV